MIASAPSRTYPKNMHLRVGSLQGVPGVHTLPWQQAAQHACTNVVCMPLAQLAGASSIAPLPLSQLT